MQGTHEGEEHSTIFFTEESTDSKRIFVNNIVRYYFTSILQNLTSVLIHYFTRISSTRIYSSGKDQTVVSKENIMYFSGDF